MGKSFRSRAGLLSNSYDFLVPKSLINASHRQILTLTKVGKQSDDGVGSGQLIMEPRGPVIDSITGPELLKENSVLEPTLQCAISPLKSVDSR